MRFLDALKVSLRAVTANRLRSGLTALGIVIGVSSVIVLMAIGQGVQKGVIERLQGLGTNLIFINPGAFEETSTGRRGGPGSGLTLTLSDAEAIEDVEIPGVIGVVSQIDLSAQAIAGSFNEGVEIVATDDMYSTVRGLNIDEGRFITQEDVDKKALNIVLGNRVVEKLFPDNSPLGKIVRISLGPGGLISFNFRVVGTMLLEGSSGVLSHDDKVFIPVSTLQARIRFIRNPTGETNVTQISIQTSDETDQDNVKLIAEELLKARHSVSEPDFVIQSQEDLISAEKEVAATLSILLGSIAGISLAVGGIGVMNIMLVSVTERTREIGIRRAVGARSRDIVRQFVAEALALCLLGGLIGILLGVGLSMFVDGKNIADMDVTTVVQPWSIGIAFLVSGGVGLLSGIYPAFRASKLDPIVALRTE